MSDPSDHQPSSKRARARAPAVHPSGAGGASSPGAAEAKRTGGRRYAGGKKAIAVREAVSLKADGGGGGGGGGGGTGKNITPGRRYGRDKRRVSSDGIAMKLLGGRYANWKPRAGGAADVYKGGRGGKRRALVRSVHGDDYELQAALDCLTSAASSAYGVLSTMDNDDDLDDTNLIRSIKRAGEHVRAAAGDRLTVACIFLGGDQSSMCPADAPCVSCVHLEEHGGGGWAE